MSDKGSEKEAEINVLSAGQESSLLNQLDHAKSDSTVIKFTYEHFQVMPSEEREELFSLLGKVQHGWTGERTVECYWHFGDKTGVGVLFLSDLSHRTVVHPKVGHYGPPLHFNLPQGYTGRLLKYSRTLDEWMEQANAAKAQSADQAQALIGKIKSALLNPRIRAAWPQPIPTDVELDNLRNSFDTLLGLYSQLEAMYDSEKEFSERLKERISIIPGLRTLGQSQPGTEVTTVVICPECGEAFSPSVPVASTDRCPNGHLFATGVDEVREDILVYKGKFTKRVAPYGSGFSPLHWAYKWYNRYVKGRILIERFRDTSVQQGWCSFTTILSYLYEEDFDWNGFLNARIGEGNHVDRNHFDGCQVITLNKWLDLIKSHRFDLRVVEPNLVEVELEDVVGFSVRPPPAPALALLSSTKDANGFNLTDYQRYYRFTEVSRYRSPDFVGIHHTDFTNMPTSWRQHDHDELVSLMNYAEVFFKTKFVKVTASGRNIEGVAISFESVRPDVLQTNVLYVVVPSFTGLFRELASWRLIPWLYGSSNFRYWVLNGTSFEGTNMTNLLDLSDDLWDVIETTSVTWPASFQYCGTTPTILNNAFAPGGAMALVQSNFVKEWRHGFSTYGYDEHFVNKYAVCPTVYFPKHYRHFREWTEGQEPACPIGRSRYVLFDHTLPYASRYVLGTKVVDVEPTTHYELAVELAIAAGFYRKPANFVVPQSLRRGHDTAFRRGFTADNATEFRYGVVRMPRLPLVAHKKSRSRRFSIFRSPLGFLKLLIWKYYTVLDFLVTTVAAEVLTGEVTSLSVIEEPVTLVQQDFGDVYILNNVTNQYFSKVIYTEEMHSRLLDSFDLAVRTLSNVDPLRLLLFFFFFFCIPGFILWLIRDWVGAWKPIPSLEDYDVTEEVDMIEIDADYPDCDRKRILFGAQGTNGDIAPLKYAARVVAKFGVPTAFRVLKHDTSEDLRRVSRGEHWDHVPAYLNMQVLYRGGWTWCYGAFNNAPRTTNIQLGPSSKWVGPFNVANTTLGILTKALMHTVVTEFSIGCLKDSNVGRSADGFNLLKDNRFKANHEGRRSVGYVLGSDDLLMNDPKVKDAIARCGAEPIRDTDHVRAFQNYRRVLCHGGAGTMQTIIASGATAYNLSTDLDRDYHRPLEPTDFKQTTPLPLIVHCYWKAGKPIPINWLIYVFPDLCRIFSFRMLLWLTFNCIKLILVPQALFNWCYVLIFLVVQFQPFVNFMMPSVLAFLTPILWFIHQNPVVLVYPWSAGPFLCLSCVYYLTFSLCEDVAVLTSQKHCRYWMQFHWVNVGKKTRLPGHVALYDTVTGQRWEGVFIRGVGAYKPFKGAARVQPRYHKDYAFEIPINLDPERIPKVEVAGRYGPAFNCQTLVLEVVGWNHALLLAPLLFAVMTGSFLIGLWLFGYYLRAVYFEHLDPTGFDVPRFGAEVDAIANWIPDTTKELAREMTGYYASGVETFYLNYKNILDAFWLDVCDYLPTAFPTFGASDEQKHKESDVVDLTVSDSVMDDIKKAASLQQNIQVISEGVPPSELDRIDQWVANKLKECSDNSSNEDLLETVGFLMTVFRDSPVSIVTHKDGSYDYVDPSGFDGEVIDDITEEESNDCMLRAIHTYLTENTKVRFDDFPVTPMATPVPRDHPDSDKRSLVAQTLDKIHEILRPIYKLFPKLVDLIAWVKNMVLRQSTYVANLMRVLEKVGSILWDYSYALWRDFLTVVSVIIDTVFNEEYAQRVKAVWAATTLVKLPALALRARLEAELNYMDVDDRSDPVTYLSEFTGGLEETYKKVHGCAPAGLAMVLPKNVDFDNLLRQGGGRYKDFRMGVNEANLRDLLTSKSIALLTSETTIDESQPLLRVAINYPTSHHDHDPSLKYIRPHRSFEGDVSTLLEKSWSDYETGGVMFGGLSRSVNFDKPMMTTEEARLLGFEEGEYVTDPEFEKRAQDYLAEGVPQGGDGVLFGVKHPERNRESYDRYVPKEFEVSPEEKKLNWEVAAALAAQFPEAFLNSKLTPPQALKYHLREKLSYSPGNPFLGLYKKRRDMFAAGWDEVLIENTYQAFRSGKYPNSIHHGFLKSQVVDAAKLVKGKDPRSVVAQPLSTNYIDNVIQLKVCKRNTHRTTGVGIGMILNQNMQGLFENLENFKNRGGYYFEADAVQFDSRNRPGNFDALSKLHYFGYKHRGEDVASKVQSIMSANYKSLQDCYILGLTENKWIGLTLGVPTKQDVFRLVGSRPDLFVRFRSEMLGDYDFSRHAGKIILTVHESKTPSKLTHPYFAYLTDSLPKTFETPKLRVDPTSQENSLDGTAVRLATNLDKIYNLHFKNRGGGTGQSATSWDNTWGYRVSFIKGWMRYHAIKGNTKSASDFFKENVLYNTGDDSMWAIRLKKSDYDYDLFVECMHEYGVDLTLQLIDEIENIQYLGQRVIRTSRHSFERSFYNDWSRVRLKQSAQPMPPDPRFLVYHDTDQTLMRRSAFRYYQSTTKGRRYLHASVQRSAGQVQLTAWKPSLYKLMAHEYIQDTKSLARYYRVRGFDAKLEKATTGEFVKTKNPWWMVRLVGQPSRHELTTMRKNFSELEEPDKNRYRFWSFILDNKFATFYGVVSISMKIRWQDPDKYDKFFERFLSDPSYADQRAREWIDFLTSITHGIPREWHKLQPTLSAIFPDPNFYTPGQLLEKFLYTHNGAENLSKDQLEDLVAQSPYGALCNVDVFWHSLSDPKFKEQLDEHPAYVYKNMVVLITLTYMLLYPFELWITRQPFIGLFWRIFILVMIDVPKVYSILNLLWWHNNGRSSTVISALIPRDPYIQMKRFAGVASSFLPMELGYILRFDLFLPFVAEFLPRLADAIRHNQQFKEQPQDSGVRPKNQWDPIVADDADFKTKFADPSTALIVTAPTGTGKSTMFPPALMQKGTAVAGGLVMPNGRHIKRIFILFPRIVLRDEWSSPLVNVSSIDNRLQSYPLSRQTRDFLQKLEWSSSIFLATYDHFVNRVISDDVHAETLYLFDEFHEQNDAMKVAIDSLRRPDGSFKCGKLVFLSATPVPVPYIKTLHFQAPIPRRFKEAQVIFRDFRPEKILNQYLWAREQFPHLSAPNQTIIRVNDFTEIRNLIQGMMEFNIMCQEVSSKTKGERIDPSKLLVCSQVIDAGINLPGRRLLIDTGYEIKQIDGQMVREPSSAITAHQLMGRVGRYSDGDLVIRPSWAGTGRPAKSYGNVRHFRFDIVANSHSIQRLCSFTHPSLFSAPKPMEYCHVLKGPSFKPQLAEEIFVILALEEAMAHSDTRLRYHFDNVAHFVRTGNLRVPIPDVFDHVYDMAKNYSWVEEPDFQGSNDYRCVPGNLLWSIEYTTTRETPEAPPIHPTSLTVLPSWEGVQPGVMLFSVRALQAKASRWIERESGGVIRQVPEQLDAKRLVVATIERGLQAQHKVAVKCNPEAEDLLNSSLETTLQAVRESISSPLSLCINKGALRSLEGLVQVPASLTVFSLFCPACLQSLPHSHEYGKSGLPDTLKPLVPGYNAQEPFTLYYDNPFTCLYKKRSGEMAIAEDVHSDDPKKVTEKSPSHKELSTLTKFEAAIAALKAMSGSITSAVRDARLDHLLIQPP